jgi:ApaG protein
MSPTRGRPKRSNRKLGDGGYEAESHGFTVRVRPTYLPEHSNPEEHRFVWAYAIEIHNQSAESAQLVSRRWTITDAAGRVEVVKGPGVIGEQPTIRPGESYSYSSGCPLTTSSGLMVGSYEMVTDAGERFEIAVPAFSLDLPQSRRVVN